MDIALARHRGRVAQVLADLRRQFLEGERALRLGQQTQGERAGVPGAKVLGREMLAHRLAQVGVHIL
jgi:hypothetical protein